MPMLPATPWRGFSSVIEGLSVLDVRNRGFVDAFMSANPHAPAFAHHRAALLRQLRTLTSQAKRAGRLRLCASLGLTFLPWSPLGGLARSSLDGPSRPTAPDPAFAAFHEIARARGVSRQQVGLAWLIGRSPGVIPIPGASRPATARASAAADLSLTTAELARLG